MENWTRNSDRSRGSAARSAAGDGWVPGGTSGRRGSGSVPMPSTLTRVAVAEAERVLAGAINCAAAGELVAAAEGCGCWWNGSRCRVSDRGALAQATLLTSDDRFPGRPERGTRWQELAALAGVARTWGD